MVRGTLVLGVLVLVVAGLVRTCSFAPGAPEVDRDALPRVDVAARLTAAASTVPFTLRVPALPPDWIAQSQDVVGLPDGRRAVRVGWVTPADTFARLVQTDADEAAVVVSEQGDPAPRGAVDVGGRRWTAHTGGRGEPLWVTEVDGTRLLVTGGASTADLTTLASASGTGRPLPR
jgi:hypothetical protein